MLKANFIFISRSLAIAESKEDILRTKTLLRDNLLKSLKYIVKDTNY